MIARAHLRPIRAPEMTEVQRCIYSTTSGHIGSSGTLTGRETYVPGEGRAVPADGNRKGGADPVGSEARGGRSIVTGGLSIRPAVPSHLGKRGAAGPGRMELARLSKNCTNFGGTDGS